MTRQPDIYPRPDMLETPEGTLRYAARLGVVLWIDESGTTRVNDAERMDAPLKAAIKYHALALRRLKLAERERNVADQARMWASGGPPWARAKRAEEVG